MNFITSPYDVTKYHWAYPGKKGPSENLKIVDPLHWPLYFIRKPVFLANFGICTELDANAQNWMFWSRTKYWFFDAERESPFWEIWTASNYQQYCMDRQLYHPSTFRCDSIPGTLSSKKLVGRSTPEKLCTCKTI